MNKKVLIYSDRLLPSSETFVRKQAACLRRYRHAFAGSRFTPACPLDRDNCVSLTDRGTSGFAREVLYKFSGVSPRFRQKLTDIGADLAHVHFGHAATTFLPVWRHLSIPMIVTFHGMDATTTDTWKDSIFHPMMRSFPRRKRELMRSASLFIAVSKFIKSKLIANGFPAGKIRVHYIGVDNFQPRNKNLDLRSPTVLFVGRLVRVKGCEYFIRSMQVVQERHPEVRAVIIGDGPLRRELENLANTRLKNYRFLGVRPHEEVIERMQRARALCAPSIRCESGAEEGFGLVLAEAQAAGLPAVGFATGGITEAIKDGKTGFLVPPENTHSMANHLCRLLDCEGLWQAFSNAARRRVRQRFDLQKQTTTLESIYDRVCESWQRQGESQQNTSEQRKRIHAYMH